eukprot:Pgem_evm1s13768
MKRKLLKCFSWNVSMLQRPRDAPQHWGWDISQSLGVLEKKIGESQADVIHLQEVPPGFTLQCENYIEIPETTQTHCGMIKTLIK